MNGLEGVFDWVLVVLGFVLLEYLGVLGQVTSFLKASLSSSARRRDETR